MEPSGVLLAEEDISRLLMSYLKSKRLIGAMVALEDETGPDPALCDLTSVHTLSGGIPAAAFPLRTPDIPPLLRNRCCETFSLKMRKRPQTRPQTTLPA